MKSISFDDTSKTIYKRKSRKRNTYVLMTKQTRLEIFNRLMGTKGITKNELVKYYNSLRNNKLDELNYEKLSYNLGMTCDLFKSYIKAYINIHPNRDLYDIEVAYKVYNKLARDLRYLTYTEGDYNGFYDDKHEIAYLINNDHNITIIDMGVKTAPKIHTLPKELCLDKFIYINHPNEKLEDLRNSTKFSNKNEVISIKQILEEGSVLGIPLSTAKIDEIQSSYNRIYDNCYDFHTVKEELNTLQDILNLPIIYSVRSISSGTLNKPFNLYTDNEVKSFILNEDINNYSLEAWETILCSNIGGIAEIRQIPIKLNLNVENTKSGIHPVDKYIITPTYSYPLSDLKPSTIDRLFNCKRVLKLIKSAN